MKKTKKVNTLRQQIDELCECVFQFNVGMAESNVAFTWKGDDLFVLRTNDFCPGPSDVKTEIYQLNKAAQKALAAIDFDIDDDDDSMDGDFDSAMAVDELFWDCLDQYKLVIFGD